MGEYDKARRDWLESQLRCPKCGEMNVPHATPTLLPEQDGSRTCQNCSLNFRPEKEGL